MASSGPCASTTPAPSRWPRCGTPWSGRSAITSTCCRGAPCRRPSSPAASQTTRACWPLPSISPSPTTRPACWAATWSAAGPAPGSGPAEMQSCWTPPSATWRPSAWLPSRCGCWAAGGVPTPSLAAGCATSAAVLAGVAITAGRLLLPCMHHTSHLVWLSILLHALSCRSSWASRCSSWQRLLAGRRPCCSATPRERMPRRTRVCRWKCGAISRPSTIWTCSCTSMRCSCSSGAAAGQQHAC